MADKNAPTIAEDEADYKPELKGRHVVVVTPDEVRRVAQLIADFTGAVPRCTVRFADGYLRTMSVEEFCIAENSPRRPVESMEIAADAGKVDGTDGPSATVQIADFGSNNVGIELHGVPEKVETLRQALEDRLASMTPAYAWFAKRDPGWMILLAAAGGMMSVEAESWGLFLASVTLGILTVVGKRFVPRTAFSIGQGSKRVETAKTVRQIVFAGLVINVLAGVVLGAVVGF